MTATETPGASNQPSRETAHPGPAQAAEPILTIDGVRWRDLLNAGLTWLERHHEIVNALNVFPVPDGDTGTNMARTLDAVVAELEAAGVPCECVSRRDRDLLWPWRLAPRFSS